MSRQSDGLGWATALGLIAERKGIVDRAAVEFAGHAANGHAALRMYVYRSFSDPKQVMIMLQGILNSTYLCTWWHCQIKRMHHISLSSIVLTNWNPRRFAHFFHCTTFCCRFSSTPRKQWSSFSCFSCGFQRGALRYRHHYMIFHIVEYVVISKCWVVILFVQFVLRCMISFQSLRSNSVRWLCPSALKPSNCQWSHWLSEVLWYLTSS